jgi:hypothetical protein
MSKTPDSHRIHCEACGRVIDCTDVDLRVYEAIGAPKCCGKPMNLPSDGSNEHRIIERRPVRRSIRADVRRVTSIPGPNLATGIADASADGAGIRLAVEVTPGEELYLCLFRADLSSLAAVRGRVGWCRPIGGGKFAVGLRFVRSLKGNELAELVH